MPRALFGDRRLVLSEAPLIGPCSRPISRDPVPTVFLEGEGGGGAGFFCSRHPCGACGMTVYGFAGFEMLGYLANTHELSLCWSHM